jgi:translation initiation factor 2A
VHAYRGPPDVTEVGIEGAAVKLTATSDDGALVALVDAQRVRIVAASSLAPVCVITAVAVIRVYFSPLGTYVVTFQRPPSDPAAPVPETLVIWDARSGARVHGWALRVPLSWPTLRWSSDEVVSAALLHKGSVVFFTGASFGRAVQHLDVPEVRQFSFSPGKEPRHVAVFVPGGQGGTPGSVQVFRYPALGAAVLKKSFQADSVSIDWNGRGSAFLLQVSVEVDKTNQSYYGKTGLHLVRLAPKVSDLRVTDESVHDCKWAPSGEEFAVIYGAMPDPKVSVFDLDGKKRMDLAEHDQSRNTLHYDPTGRVLCVGGFASLKGDMDFWDIASPTLKKLGKANAFSSAFHAWSPDGRYFVACVLSPRIRIDNGIKYFDCYGQLLHEISIPELFEVRWVPWAPTLVTSLRSRPLSPRRAVKPLAALPSSSSASGVSSSPSPTGKSGAATSAASTVYRHPNWKGSATSISAPKSEAATPVKYDAMGNAARGSTPIGGKPIGGTPIGGKPVGGNPVGGQPKQQQQQQNKPKPKPQPQPQEEKEEDGAEITPANKKRNLEKKLRQIEVLKQREGKGDVLNAEQKAKVATEQRVRDDIAELAKQLGEDA